MKGTKRSPPKRSSPKRSKEVYYFSLHDVKNVIHKKDKHNYVNSFIIPMYLTESKDEAVVGYYNAFHDNSINEDLNNVNVRVSISTPNGIILAHTAYVTDVDKNFLTKKKASKLNYICDTSSEYYKSPKMVVSILSDTNRKLTIYK